MNILIAEAPGYSERGLALFKECAWTVRFHDGDLRHLPEATARVDGVLVRFGLRWDADALQRAHGLKFIGVAATGTDHIDAAAARARGVRVVSLAGHPGLRDITATPEHAVGLLLALLRNTVPAHQSVLAGQWNRDAHLGRKLQGKTVGVIGLGRTGSAFASMVAAFDAKVVYYDPFVESAQWSRCADLADLARVADVVSVHAVYNEETHGLLNAAFFDALRPGAWLVNTARGGIVDENALIAALRSGRLAGAALDVLAREPEKGEPLESPLVDYARAHDNLILTPHIGGATAESIEHAEWLLATALIDAFGGAEREDNP